MLFFNTKDTKLLHKVHQVSFIAPFNFIFLSVHCAFFENFVVTI